MFADFLDGGFSVLWVVVELLKSPALFLQPLLLPMFITSSSEFLLLCSQNTRSSYQILLKNWTTTVAKIVQKSTKNRPKIHQKSTKIGSWAPRAPKSPPSPFQAQQGEILSAPHRSLLGGFLGHVGPKSHQKTIQNASKILLDVDIDFLSIFDRFWEDFGRVLGAMLAPKMHYKVSSNFEYILNRFFNNFW